MRAIDLEFKDYRLKVDPDWRKYGFDMPVIAALDLVVRLYTPNEARKVNFEDALIQSKFPFSAQQRNDVILHLIDKNALLDK